MKVGFIGLGRMGAATARRLDVHNVPFWRVLLSGGAK